MISPWLFNIVIAPIIKRIEEKIGIDNVAAYADDLFILCEDGMIEETIKEIRNMAKEIGININDNKTMIMPLFRRKIE